ncbi:MULTISPECIES: hypothetical protein [unclassified Microcoleus]|uniref:hypothetical protein n=1 Tax=unclassified Microcoleus TaxID=2642155 RepID=UPI0025EBDC8A|nr:MULTISPECIES: hypothetical protein [unclassified Microcoleus]
MQAPVYQVCSANWRSHLRNINQETTQLPFQFSHQLTHTTSITAATYDRKFNILQKNKRDIKGKVGKIN